jgi:hypothetical protein
MEFGFKAHERGLNYEEAHRQFKAIVGDMEESVFKGKVRSILSRNLTPPNKVDKLWELIESH